MGLLVSANTGGNYATAPAGVHIARCFMMVDLGTQNDSFQGKPKIAKKIRIGWELPEATHIFKDEKGPEPFTLSKKYTANLGDRSNLRKDLKSWRGKDFSEAELKEFDLKSIVGVCCQINVVHEPDKKDPTRTRANIGAIMPLSAAQRKAQPEAVNDPLVYMVEDGTSGAFAKLPEWIQKEVQLAQEFQVTKDPNHQADAGEDGAPDDDDSSPF